MADRHWSQSDPDVRGIWALIKAAWGSWSKTRQVFWALCSVADESLPSRMEKQVTCGNAAIKQLN